MPFSKIDLNASSEKWCSRGSAVASIVLSLALVPLLAPGVAHATESSVSGSIQMQAFTGPGCTSPIALCAYSTWSGSLTGQGVNTAQTATPSGDLTSVTITEDETLQLGDGVLQLSVVAQVETIPSPGSFHSTYTIVGGTGHYAGASGTIYVTGQSDGVVGTATYTGQLHTEP